MITKKEDLKFLEEEEFVVIRELYKEAILEG